MEADAAAKTSRGAVWLCVAAILVMAGIAYHNSLDGEFMFDDLVWIKDNPSIQQLSSLGDLFFPDDAAHVGGRPVVSLTLALNYHFGKLDVRTYHATNLVIHAIVALVLFGVVRRTLMLPSVCVAWASAHANDEALNLRGLKPTLRNGDLPPLTSDFRPPTSVLLALAVALIWLVHPLQTEAVSYIIQRTECLVALFYLLTLYCVIRGATAEQPRRRTAWYALAVVTCLLGMLTKEVMVTAPLVVLLYDAIFLSGSWRQSLAQRGPVYAGMAATAGVLAWALVSTSFHAETTGFAVPRFTSWQYLCTEPGVLLMYLRLAVWPDSLCFAYDFMPATDIRQIVAPGLIIVGLLAATVWGLIKWPKIGFLGAAFFLILAPTSTFIPILDAAFEHRMYLPLAPLVCLVVIGGYWLWDRFVLSRNAAPSAARAVLTVIPLVLFVGALAGLTYKTIDRNRDYQSAYAIWKDTTIKRPNNPRAHYNLARALSAQGKTADALAEYRETVHIDPSYAAAYQNMGSELAQRGNLDGAYEMFQKAIAVRPSYAEAHWNLGVLLMRRGQFADAIRQFRVALSINPAYADVHLALGRALALSGQLPEAAVEIGKYLRGQPNSSAAHSFHSGILADLGRLDEALTHARRALELDPKSSEAHAALASVFMKSGDTERAASSFEQALALDPGNAQTHYLLGQVLKQRGDAAGAIEQWRRAIEIAPNVPQFLDVLALTLATAPDSSLRNGAEAVELARRASGLCQGQNPIILATWAAAEAEAGAFPKAIELAERAIDLAGDSPEHAAFVASTRAQIKLYEAGTALREPRPSGRKEGQ